MTNIDWNKVIKDTEEGTKVIPAGEYPVRIVDAQAVTASTGAPMIKTTVKLEDPSYATRSVTTNLVFTFDNAVAMKMLFRRLAAIGITAEWLAESGASVSQIAEAIKGRSTIAKISVRKWQGEDRNDVEMFLDGMGAGVPGAPTVTLGSEDAPPVPELGGLSEPAPPTPTPTGPPPASTTPSGPAPF